MYMFRNDQQKLIESVKQYASELEGLFATDEQSSDAPAPAPSRESPTRASESAPGHELSIGTKIKIGCV